MTGIEPLGEMVLVEMETELFTENILEQKWNGKEMNIS